MCWFPALHININWDLQALIHLCRELISNSAEKTMSGVLEEGEVEGEGTLVMYKGIDTNITCNAWKREESDWVESGWGRMGCTLMFV